MPIPKLECSEKSFRTLLIVHMSGALIRRIITFTTSRRTNSEKGMKKAVCGGTAYNINKIGAEKIFERLVLTSCR